MALSFPASPSDGQIYTQGAATWEYNASQNKWSGYVSQTSPLPSGTVNNQILVWDGTDWVPTYDPIYDANFVTPNDF